MLERLGILRPRAALPVETNRTFTAMDPEFIRFFLDSSSSGKVVTEETAVKLAAAWCCQRILSESIGMLPWAIFKRDSMSKNAVQADDHWLADVLMGTPNRDQTPVEYKETLTAQLCGAGNAYSLRENLGTRLTSLYPLQGVKVMRKQGSNTSLNIPEGAAFYKVPDRGQYEDYPREKIWQVKGFGRDPLVGLSPVAHARESIGGGLAMEDFANRFFKQGGMPAGTVTYPGWLTKDQREAAKDTLQKLVGGLGNAHQFAMFEGGVKPEPWNTMNLEDMQFIVSRKFSVTEICRIYRIPPHMVAELEKGASYASIEQMSQEFVMFTLYPYFTRFEASVERWLLTPSDRAAGYFLRFNPDALLRAASKERADFLGAMVDHGLMSRNEARAKENLNRVDKPGMDDYTVQTALTPIQMLGKQPAPSPAIPPRGDN